MPNWEIKFWFLFVLLIIILNIPKINIKFFATRSRGSAVKYKFNNLFKLNIVLVAVFYLYYWVTK